MRSAAFVVMFATVAGCASLGKQAFVQPQVALRDVRVMGLGVTGGELEVALGVRNPNNYRMDASHLSYQVFVSDSVPVAGGQLDTRSTVQAGDSSIIKIPVMFTYAGLGAAGRQLMNTGVVAYKVTGAFTVETVVGNFNVPFTTTGRYSTMRR